MKRVLTGLGVLTLLALVSLAEPVHAQTAANTTRPERPFSYDITKETKINGKISSVVMKPTQGMLWGSHLMVKTSTGVVDASLGTIAMRGKDAPSFSIGDQVEVTGVMKTLKNQQVFLARTVKVGEQVYTIRNQNGFPVRETARDRESQPAAQNEVQP